MIGSAGSYQPSKHVSDLAGFGCFHPASGGWRCFSTPTGRRQVQARSRSASFCGCSAKIFAEPFDHVASVFGGISVTKCSHAAGKYRYGHPYPALP